MDLMQTQILSDFPESWRQLLQKPQGGTNRESGEQESAVIPEGRRHTAMTSLAGSLLNKGVNAAGIRAALLGVNQEC
jgi:primase-like protein